jgi:outer membrane receptor protein involved in Fe transport
MPNSLQVALNPLFGIWVTLGLLLGHLVQPHVLCAQSSTASVNGTIRDASGAVAPGVALTLRNVETGVERQGASNEAGVYVFVNILPGSYTLEAAKEGFTTSRLAPFRLAVNQTATLDFTLNVGALGQSVNVEATGAEIQSSTSELGAVVNYRQVVDLPLNGRNFTEILTLTPGVSPIAVGGSGGFAPGTNVTPAVNGQNNRSNFFMLDGVFNSSGWGSGSYALAPIVDTIQEFKVQSHNDEAEFGGALGGLVNVVTKGGTNEFHGSLWEYLRNDAFDARNFFQRSVTPFRWNQFGVSAGGPVVMPKLYHGQNRTFFLLAYQGYRLRRPATNYYRVPTPANLTGDLSDIPAGIFNPYTTRPDPDNPSKFVRDPFPNNQIPANLLDPTMLLFAKTLPAPIPTGISDRNALDQTPSRTNQEEYSARVDQTIGSKDLLWFRWSGATQDILGSGGRQGISRTQAFSTKNVAGAITHTVSAYSILQAQMSRVSLNQQSVLSYDNLPPDYAKAFSDRAIRGFSNGSGEKVPAISVPTFFSDPTEDAFRTPQQATWQWRADYTKIMGNHHFKMGGEFSTNGWEAFVFWNTLTFSPIQTADPANQGSTGSPLASFLLNVPDAATRRNTHESLRLGGVMSYYFQDQWKVASRLTINLGLRYDRTFIPPYGKMADGNIYVGNMDMTLGVYSLQFKPPACEETHKAPCIPTPGGALPDHVVVDPRGKILYDTSTNWGPRVGLAYRLTNKIALRSAFGIFYDNWAGVSQTAQAYQGSWPSVDQQGLTNMNRPTLTQLVPDVRGTNPPFTGFIPAPSPFPQYGWFQDPHERNPYSMQWNFGVQHQLTPSTLVTANYAGSGSRRLDIGGIFNVAKTPGPGDYRLRSPFPYMGASYFDRSWGKSNYSSLQVSMNKAYSNGLTALLSYTWSKSIDAGTSGWYGLEGYSIQDPYHFNNDRSASGFDIPHMLSAAFVYELPIGRGKRFRTGSRVADHVVGNWQWNGIVTLRSGQPFNLNVAGDIPNTGGDTVRPNLVGNPYPDQRSPNQWLLRSAFEPPAQYTFGNVGRYVFRSDWSRNLDFSVFRQFPIRESKRLEFRAEAFNTTNTPVFGIPAGNISFSNFGQVTATANSPRQLQLALKVMY